MLDRSLPSSLRYHQITFASTDLGSISKTCWCIYAIVYCHISDVICRVKDMRVCCLFVNLMLCMVITDTVASNLLLSFIWLFITMFLMLNMIFLYLFAYLISFLLLLFLIEHHALFTTCSRDLYWRRFFLKIVYNIEQP